MKKFKNMHTKIKKYRQKINFKKTNLFIKNSIFSTFTPYTIIKFSTINK